MESATAVLRGLGKSLESAIITLIGACLLRILWLVTVFEWVFTLECLYLIYPISQFVTALFTYFVIEGLLRKILKEKAEQEKNAIGEIA
jgi:Na+-driven multidrug efflux pump